MSDTLIQAVAAGFRAFADKVDELVGHEDGPTGATESPAAGRAESMLHVLSAVADINDQDGRGVGDDEIRHIARQAGIDPRGMAGYYTEAAQLLAKRDESRWITDVGRARLETLRQHFGY